MRLVWGLGVGSAWALQGTTTTTAAEGRAVQHHHRAQAEVNKLGDLEARRGSLTAAEEKMRASLLRRDVYNAGKFTHDHAAFKRAHSRVFARLVKAWCADDASVFYLEGADGGTTRELRAAGLVDDHLVVANRHEDTCDALRRIHGLTHVSHGAAEALLPALVRRHGLAAFYLDGCGGDPAPLVAMIHGIFFSPHKGKEEDGPRRLAVGLTLTDAEPTGRSLADREQDLTRALAACARAHACHLFYVGDDPERFGLDTSPPRRAASTQTVWFALERRSA